VNVSLLKGYLNRVGPSGILPGQEDELRAMLRAYWLNNMVIELGHELKSATGQLRIPLQDILQLLDGQPPPPTEAVAAAPEPVVQPPPSAIE